MSRSPGIKQRLILPAPPDQYNVADQRELRNLIVQAVEQPATFDALNSVPAPLVALSGLTGAANMVPYFSGVSTMVLTALTPFARTILACANAAAVRAALGLGSLAVLNTVGEGNITLADVLTLNVSSAGHGFAPKAVSDAAKFLNGAATPAYAQVKDADLALTDITTNDVSITKHGFTPKAPNDTSVFLRGDGTWAAAVNALPAYPITSGGGLMFRWNALLSQTDQTTQGYASKLYDISGNARHSDVAVAGREPKFLMRGFNHGYPGIWFFGSNRITISALPGLGSPLACTIIVVGQDFTIQSANSHIYNWAGSPIGFGSNTPLDFMYNGTLPTAHAMSQKSKDNLPTGIAGHVMVSMHVFNGASSVQSINKVEETKNPGTGATGSTNSFSIGADSATSVGSFSKMILHEIAIVSNAISLSTRNALYAYYAAICGTTMP